MTLEELFKLANEKDVSITIESNCGSYQFSFKITSIIVEQNYMSRDYSFDIMKDLLQEKLESL